MFNKKSVLMATLVLSIVLLAGCTADKTLKTNEEGNASLPEVIKIGYVGPLTGNVAAYGQDVKSGIDLYFKQNPTIKDKKVEVIYEDGKCNGQDATNAAQKLINIDKVQIILGGQCSGETLAVAPIAEQNKVILFSSISSSPEVATAGDYVFRNYPSDDQVAKTMVDMVLKNHKKVALLTEQADYSQGYRGAIKKHMNIAKRSEDLVVDEAFAVDNADFRTLLSKVKDAEAEVLILIPNSPVTGGFAAKQAKELGLEIQIYVGDSVPGPDFFDTAKDAAEGVRAVLASEDPSREGYQSLTSQLGEAQASTIFPLFGYDSAQIIAEAINAVGYDATAIKGYLYDMPTFNGVASDVKFDANGDNNVSASVKVAKGGEFVLLSEAMEGESMESDQ